MGDFCENCETYTRYSWVADKEQKKNMLSVLNGSFLSSLVGGGKSLQKSFKVGVLTN